MTDSPMRAHMRAHCVRIANVMRAVCYARLTLTLIVDVPTFLSYQEEGSLRDSTYTREGDRT